MFVKCLVIAAFASSAWARTTAGASQNAIHQETARSEEGSSYMGDLRYVYSVYKECSAADLASCLKLKLLAALDRVARANSDVNLIDGVSLVKDAKAEATAVPNSEAEIEATLPRSIDERENALNSMLVHRIANFFETHTLQVKLPSASELQRSFSEVGRAKKKKNGVELLLNLLFGNILVPVALGALALLVGKALIVSKIALVLAGILGIKKFLGSSVGLQEPGHVDAFSGHGSGWGRSYDKEQAQKLAYSAYVQKTR